MLLSKSKFLSIAAATALTISAVQAGIADSPSVVTYWGQNSANGADTQKPLASYCDDNSDIMIVSFVLNFSDGSLPWINLANSCQGPVFPGTQLLQCDTVGEDIKTCQDKGKTVLLSLGGASGAYGFKDDTDAEAFADTLWNLFGAGSSDTRPFGDAVVDGFDLDIEGGGPTGYAAMIKRLRKHFKNDGSKDYYITGAPQCPYPDAMLGTVLDAVEFDAVNVQFYNNYCSTTSDSFNFDTWDKWAKETSPNPDVKIFLGVPGSSTAAGSGYVKFDDLDPIVKDVYSSYSSFGGVSIWDASQSYANTDVSPNYQSAVADLVHNLSDDDNKSTTTTKKHTTSTTKNSTSKTTSDVTTTTSETKTTKTPHTKTTKTPHTKTTKTPHTKSTKSKHTKSTKSKHTKSTKSKTSKTKTKPTKTSKTKTSTTTSSADPTSTSTCITPGSSCSPDGLLACSGNQFATCDHGKWVLRDCPSTLTCFSTTDGLSLYCGQGTSGSTCANVNNLLQAGSFLRVNKMADTSKDTYVGPTAKPYKNGRIIAQFSVSNSDAKSFKAVINARRLDQQTFGSTITVTFKVADNIKITGVTNGKVTQTGNQVKIQYSNSSGKSMAAVIKLEGEITSGIFVAPNANSMKFSS